MLIEIVMTVDSKWGPPGQVVRVSEKSAQSVINSGYGEYYDYDKHGPITGPEGNRFISNIPNTSNVSNREEFPTTTSSRAPELDTNSSVNDPIVGTVGNSEGQPESTRASLKSSHYMHESSHYNEKVKEKEKNKVLLDVRNVGTVGNVRRDLTFLTSNNAFYFCFGESLLTRVLAVMYEANRPMTYDEIASNLSGDNRDSITTTIGRHADYFQPAGKNGLLKLHILSAVGETKVEELFDRYVAKQRGKGLSMAEQEAALKKSEDLKIEASRLLSTLTIRRDVRSLYLDFREIAIESPAFADLLLDEPDKVMEAFTESIGEPGITLRFTDLPPSAHVSIENLRHEHIDKLVVLEGRSVSLSSVRPIIKSARFECGLCGAVITMYAENDRLKRPRRCAGACRSSRFKLLTMKVTNGCNLMLEDLQEKTDNPHLQRLRCLVENELVQPHHIAIFTPGNEIKATGILRSRIKEKGEDLFTNMDIVFEVMHAEPFQTEISRDGFTHEEITAFKELAAQIDQEGLHAIRDSFAPEVFGYEHIKEAVILQLCSRRNDLKHQRTRNKPNVLLIGDPGVSKSLIGRFAVSVTPGARKALGGGSSGVGLTASTIKEEDDLGGWRVEPGAMVLAKELLFIDELNNLNDDDKPKLQEGMNEQTITINKANIHVTLRVSCGILAAANPANGFFDPKEDIIGQFNIPVPIMNRFDIIFVLLDEANVGRDSKIARHMLDRETDDIHSTLTREFIRKFFVYIRDQPDPTLSPEVKERIQSLYADLRAGETRRVVINPRFVESLIRLAKASAKIRLAPCVEGKDIDRCMDILKFSHYDPAQRPPLRHSGSHE